MSFGNCGYAFPTIIGAKVAAPHRPAISYAGDGAWGMSLIEIMTCVRHNIPVTAVVFHNRQWGAEKKNQVDFYNRRFVAGELDNQSFAGIARAMGAEGIVGRQAGGRRPGAEEGHRPADEPGQDLHHRDHVHPRAGRPVPPRCAVASRCAFWRSTRITCRPATAQPRKKQSDRRSTMTTHRPHVRRSLLRGALGTALLATAAGSFAAGLPEQADHADRALAGGRLAPTATCARWPRSRRRSWASTSWSRTSPAAAAPSARATWR